MKLDESLEDIKNKIKNIMLTWGELGNGYLYIHSPNHTEFFSIPSYAYLNSPVAKDAINPMLLSLVKKCPEIDLIAICTEAWVSQVSEPKRSHPVKRPSKDPNRVEAVIIAGINTDGIVRCTICPFSRKPNEFTFIEDDRLKNNDATVESRFFDGLFGYKFNDCNIICKD